MALGGADGFEQADLPGPLGDRYEHDVDDADGAEAERDDADAAQEYIHGVEDGPDHFFFFHGVELVEGVFERGSKPCVRR